MAVILEPMSGNDLMINWWNWRPTVALLVRAGILPDGERAERCLGNGYGGHLSENEALRAAEYLDTLLTTMKSDQRILFDGAVTNQPIDFEKPISDWDEAETWNHYSAQYDVLKTVADFCRRSGGFVVL